MKKEDFIKKSQLAHGTFYSYDKVPEEVGSNDKVEIFCPLHGCFEQRASAHYSQNHGCPSCAKEHLWDKRQKPTTADFVEKANKKFNGWYKYTKTVYKKATEKVIVICPIHGEFEIIAANHLSGQGCPVCAKEKTKAANRLGREEIIKRANIVHNNKYEYEKSEAESTSDIMEVFCNKHGIFKVKVYNHLNGIGCPECSKEETEKKKQSRRIIEQHKFISKSMFVHGGFFSYDKTEYVSSKKKVVVTCPIHGDFETIPANHVNGGGCPQCEREKNGIRCRLTKEEFVKRAKLVHGENYNYDKSEYLTLETPLTITCPIHGDFLQTPMCHLHGCGCPHCHRSKGEERIEQYLIRCGIVFEIQKRIEIKEIKDTKKFLLLDFYLPNYNTVIEYNGEHHYKPVSYFGGNDNFEKQKKRDEGLRMYCKEKNINLIEIPYTEYKNIENILDNELNNLKLKSKMDKKEPTKSQVLRRIKNSPLHLERTKDTISVYFDDKGVRLTVDDSENYALIATGSHTHYFQKWTNSGLSRPFLYTKRVIELATKNDCEVRDNKGNVTGRSYAMLLDTLKKKEDKSEYNIAYYYSWYLLNCFSPLYSIGESEVESFMVYFDYCCNIAKNAIMLSEKTEDVTNKQFIEKFIENLKEFTDNMTESVLFHKKTDEEVMQENMEAAQEIELNEQMKS